MIKICYALFVFMLSMLNIGDALAISYSPMILQQQSIYGDTLGVDQFWQKLKEHCGKTYEGTITSGATANDGFSGKRLAMHVLSCSEDQLLIPFNVGENRSRTWILTKVKDRIELKHDHRHEDGTNDAVTMYGGTSTNSGLPGIAVFPADQMTIKTIPAAATNVWWMTINNTTFTYNLRRIGSDRLFTVTFDITKPVDKPLPSWGWENFK
jgi:hypothetical protein